MSTPLDRANDRALGGASNYPAGADTPDAPWNQTSPDNCPACRGEGEVACPDCKVAKQWCGKCEEGRLTCEDWLGTGEEHKPSREEIAIDKADRDRDSAKDREAEARQ